MEDQSQSRPLYKVITTDKFYIRGRGTIFIVSRKNNSHVDWPNIRKSTLEIEGERYVVIGIDCIQNNFEVKDEVGLVVKKV